MNNQLLTTKTPMLLQGCTPEPLSNYLKALGILRLIVEQGKDPNARGYWQSDSFLLDTILSQDELVQFCLHDYQPTPLIAPWNGSTGFYPKDNKKTLDAVRNSQATRLGIYRKTIEKAEKQVRALGLTVQPKDAEKRQLITRLRNHLPDEAVKWLDTCALITSETTKFPPLTGTGGNDGNFEFSRTFMQQLQELIDFETGNPKDGAELSLRASLFNDIVPGLQFAGKIGQFNPIAAGGANAAPGYDADSRVNPWDFVLMLEGIMLFVASATRRYEQSEQGDLAYPFTVRPSTSGYGSASEKDKVRAELWTPLWSSPTGLKELQLLFSEGRAKVNGRAARDGVDFARAVSTLGVNRGIHEFIRYSFQERNGLSYFAIPLGRFQPKFSPHVNRLAQIDDWLSRLRGISQDEATPASVRRAYRGLETTIIELAQDKARLLDVVIALGEVEKALDRSRRFVLERRLPPLPYLRSSRWLQDCDDGSREFRLGLSLATTGLRERLVYVRGDYAHWSDLEDGKTVWQEGNLVKNLLNLLRRLEIESEQAEKREAAEGTPVQSSTATNTQPPLKLLANLDDVLAWINGTVDDQRIEAIARGLSLIRPSRKLVQWQRATFKPPAAFALVALTHHRRLNAKTAQQEFQGSSLTEDITLPRIPELIARLSTGDSVRATTLAINRLRASGLRPAISAGIYEPSDRTLRIAAALAFPLSDANIAQLLKHVQRTEDKEEHHGL